MPLNCPFKYALKFKKKTVKGNQTQICPKTKERDSFYKASKKNINGKYCVAIAVARKKNTKIV